jgi:O-antigen/teichoic acid export membrane protein
MKQSIWLIILQVVSIVLGLFTTFFVAGSLSSEVYAVVGIYTVISSIISVFSNTGLETYAGRNVLAWNSIGKTEKTKEIVTQAIFVRFLVASFLVLPMILYSFYMSKYKFEDAYFGLFILMSFFSVIKAMNDSINLILKSFNKYLLASISMHSVNVFGRLIALYFFFKFGFLTYIYIILVLPLIVTIPLIYNLRSWIDLSYLRSIKHIMINVKQNRFYTFSAYFNYGIKHIDLMLVSILLPVEITGTYTLLKRIQSIVNNFIANLFDPFMQKITKYKRNIEKWRLQIKMAHKIQTISLLTASFGLVLTYLFLDYFILKISLTQYPYLKIYILMMLFAQVIMIAFKVRYQLIMFFYSPKQTLITAAVYGFSSILSFLLIAPFTIKYLPLFLILSNLIMLVFVYSYAPNISKVEKEMEVNIET